MTNGSERGLTPFNPGRLPTRQTAPMPLDEARQILQSVVSTHESTITPATPLEVVAGFSTEQIREAATVVGLAVVSTHRSNNTSDDDCYDSSDMEVIEKTTPHDRVSLTMYKRYIKIRRKHIIQYTRVNLAFVRDGNYQIESEFPLHEPEDDTDRIYVNYHDFRNKRLLSLWDIQNSNKFSLGDFQHLFRGARWLFANMLDWDRRDLIMPEQLDHLFLQQ